MQEFTKRRKTTWLLHVLFIDPYNITSALSLRAVKRKTEKGKISCLPPWAKTKKQNIISEDFHIQLCTNKLHAQPVINFKYLSRNLSPYKFCAKFLSQKSKFLSCCKNVD